VYYAGTEAEERDKFVAHWPPGSRGSFTLNSNHEVRGDNALPRQW